ncbi:MAG: hypothetical protein ACREOU_01455 [Candidatus Eiseniibacteriota bacterium]
MARGRTPGGSTSIGVTCLLACVMAAGTHLPPAGAAGRPDRFLIGAWGIGKVGDPARLVRLNDAGIDYVQNWDLWGPGGTRLMVAQVESLQVARPGFRLQALLHSRMLSSDPAKISDPMMAGPDAVIRRRELDPSRGINGPGVLGWFVWDEPCDRAQIDRYGRLSRTLATDPRSRDQLVFMNLLPLQEPDASNCLDAYGSDRVSRYRAYVDAYLSQFDSLDVPAPILSMDMYPFQNESREGRAYFECLSIVRDKAAEYSRPGARIPLWVIVQSSSYVNASRHEHRTPTIPQIRWQVWSALAYGAKGIAYWTAVPNWNEATREGWGDGLLDAEGRPSAKYDAIRSLNRELHALGPTLLELDAVTALHVKPGNQVGLDDAVLGSPRSIYNIVAGVEASSGRDDCLIGYLKHARTGDDYLVIVNRSTEKDRSFRVTLTSPATAVERISPSSGAPERISLDGRSFTVPALTPGAGALFRVQDGIEEYIPGVVAIDDTGTLVTFSRNDARIQVDYRTGRRTVEFGTGGEGPGARAGATPADRAAAPRFRATPLGIAKAR